MVRVLDTKTFIYAKIVSKVWLFDFWVGERKLMSDFFILYSTSVTLIIYLCKNLIKICNAFGFIKAKKKIAFVPFLSKPFRSLIFLLQSDSQTLTDMFNQSFQFQAKTQSILSVVTYSPQIQTSTSLTFFNSWSDLIVPYTWKGLPLVEIEMHNKMGSKFRRWSEAITLNWRVSVQNSQISNCIVAQTDWTLIRWPLASLLFTYNLVFIFVMGHGYWIYTYFLFPFYGLKFCVLLLKINHGCMLGVSLIWIIFGTIGWL